MTSVMVLDGVRSFLRLKMLQIYIQWNGGKLEDAEDFKCVFIVYCVLDSLFGGQLYKINHSL